MLGACLGSTVPLPSEQKDGGPWLGAPTPLATPHQESLGNNDPWA